MNSKDKELLHAVTIWKHQTIQDLDEKIEKSKKEIKKLEDELRELKRVLIITNANYKDIYTHEDCAELVSQIYQLKSELSDERSMTHKADIILFYQNEIDELNKVIRKKNCTQKEIDCARKEIQLLERDFKITNNLHYSEKKYCNEKIESLQRMHDRIILGQQDLIHDLQNELKKLKLVINHN